MHKIFGTKQAHSYTTRHGAYLIPIQNDCVAVISTNKGYFLIGGGIQAGESKEDAITRECMEETGWLCTVEEFVCSAEAYLEHPTIGHFHPKQYYYLGKLTMQTSNPIESGHYLKWISYENIRGNLFLEMQNWALEQCWKYLHMKKTAMA